MKYFLGIVYFILFSYPIYGQQNTALLPTIKTLRIIANENWEVPPIITLGEEESLVLSFDELTHDFHNYRYKITHCNANWEASNLSEMDYIDGFNDNLIEDYERSMNTTLLYTHYQFTLPNDNVQLISSGNFQVAVYDEDKPEKNIALFYFSIVDPKTSIRTSVSSNTLIDTNRTHQQVNFSVNYKEMNLHNAQSELKTVVLQNRRWDNAVFGVNPTSVTGQQANYTNNRHLIFEAGNEYRRFELTNANILMQGVKSIQRFEPYYHATLYTDFPRKNYIFDKDQNGLYVIRYDDAQEDDTEADYIFVHFSLSMDSPLLNKKVYLQGAFTNDLFTEENQMKYNFKTKTYEGVELLKMGAYNYLYLSVPHGENKGSYMPIEGDFYQTENEYLILIYYRPFGTRYDQLIGVQRVKYQD